MLNLEKIIAKELADVTAEEKAFLITCKEDLDTETVKKFKLDETEKTEEEKENEEAAAAIAKEAEEKAQAEAQAAAEAKEAEEKELEEKIEAAEKSGLDKFKADCKAKGMSEDEITAACKKYKEKQKMSETAQAEKIQMSEKIQALEKENEAFKMREKEALVAGELNKVIFSETNKKASFLPKQKEAIQEFAMKLNDEDCKKFFEILDGAKKANLFSEEGSDEDNDEKELTKAKDGTPIDTESKELSDEAARISASEKVSFEQALIMAEKKLKK